MEQNDTSSTVLRAAFASSPIVIVGCSFIYLVLKRYDTRYPRNPVMESVTVSLQKRKLALILFSALQTIGCLLQFLQHSLRPDEQDLYDTLASVTIFFTWLILLILSFTSPTMNNYKDRAYTHIFTLNYAYLFLVSIHYILTSDKVEYWDIAYCTICFVLEFIAGTTPQPYHPRDFQVAEYEVLEIKDGSVYRNGLLLSPESTASIFSWAAFQWMNPLIVFGFNNVVTRQNIYALTFQHLTRTTYEDFVDTKKYINQYKVLRRIYSSNKREIWSQFMFSTIACFVSYLSPFFQQKFLQYIELKENRPPIQIAYLYVLSMFLVGIIKLLCNSIQLWMGRRWNIRTMMMLDSEIFSKTLRRKDTSGKISKDAKEEKDTADNGKKKKDKKEAEQESGSFSNIGKITNLMSVDADKLSDIPAYIFMLYNSPVEVFIAILYLYMLLGNAALIGLVVMILCLPITGILTNKMASNYTALTSAKDRRNELVNELLQGIRMVKFFAWEGNWKEKVYEARRHEIKQLINTIIVDVLVHIVFLTVPVLVTASTFIWYTKVAGNELTASVAFVSITLFEMLRAPLIFIPEIVTTFTEGYVSLKRISNYLEEAEVEENLNKEPVEIPGDESPQSILARTGFESSVFQWHVDKAESNGIEADEMQSGSSSPSTSTLGIPDPNNQRVFQLNVPKFNFPTGKLSLVYGATGSGKSSFLNALLGEMDIISGRVYLPSKVVLAVDNVSKIDPDHPDLYLDKVAYVAQQPFLQHASIRDNILFGLPYNAERYKKALYQCALIKDLTILPDGDRTEIGEKGISLSGGQKQRVSLARAVYSNAKTVLLDDVLSSIDSHTSKHIYKKCLLGDLLQGRTVILVTHQVRLCLPGAKFLVKIENGQVLGCDTIDNLRSSGQLPRLLGNEHQNEDDGETEEDIEEDANTGDVYDGIDLDNKAEAAKLVKEETSEKGQVKLKVYLTYLAACGGWFFWISLILTYVFARLMTFGENWWLRIWAAASETDTNSALSALSADYNPQFLLMTTKTKTVYGVFDTLGAAIQKQNIFKSWVFEEKAPINVDFYIGVYIAICFGYIVTDVFRNVLVYWGSIRGARTLFDSLLDRIIHAPMRFFDTTPVGRILNRFGKDVSTIDLDIARSASFLIECVTAIIASTIVISMITPQFLLVAIVISCLYFIIGLAYLRISRELKRLNSVSRSPIYSHFTESLVGVATIRAYGVQDQFMRTVYEKIDSYISPFYLLWMSNRWLYCRIEFAGAFVTFFTGLFLILNINHIDAGMAGISLFYARSFLENIYWFIRQYTSVEMNLNSVERVQEYLELEQEPPAIIEAHRPPAAWPTTASLDVKDLVIRYSPELDPVLHGVSFATKAHEKIGIVGRTGSGKSTLSLSFFRFLEPSSGSISIDGIDISTIGIQDLRSQITIIPQDAVLFSGTIRSNLDPFEEHSDGAIWESLERAHLSKASDRLSKQGQPTGHSTPNSSSSITDEDEHRRSAITSLYQQVSDGGSNFSQGQRQLLCLARALLKNSKLIIMDEATASVDFDTDTKIQTTIREEFTNSTLLCIAHRLRTVIDYDRVLVLDQGRVVEYDTPYNLLVRNNGAGIFKSMCEKSGELELLLTMAAEAHGNRDHDEISPDNHAQLY